MAYAGYLIRLRPLKNIVFPKYLSLMLRSPEVRTVIEASSRSSSGVHNVNAQELGSIVIPLTSLDDQIATVNFIENKFSWLERIAIEQGQAAKLLHGLNEAILAKAYRGELVSQSPEDEPTSETLKRVSAGRKSSSQALNKRIGKITMARPSVQRKLEEVLKAANNWIAAGDGFRLCNIADKPSTEALEQFYSQLRDLDRKGSLEVRAVKDAAGRKLYDELKMNGAQTNAP